MSLKFDKYSAIAVTGCLGQMLGGQGDNFDLADLKCSPIGEEQTMHQREIESEQTIVLKDILTSNNPAIFKYDLLARKVLEEGIDSNKKVKVGFNGRLKEIRIGKHSYRMFGKTYYGCNRDQEDLE